MINKNAYIYNFCLMTSLLARHFAEGRVKNTLSNYIMLMNKKSAKTIDEVIPGLCQNLFKSTEAFIEGVASLDSQFIESTSSTALQQKLLYQFQQMKNNQSEIRQRIIKNSDEPETKNTDGVKDDKYDGKFLSISPYVIFGQRIQQRNKSRKPWNNCKPLLSTNRFIQTDAKDLSLKTIFQNQIYGFNCFYQNKNIAYEIVEKGKIIQSSGKIFVVSFETDSENHEFFVSDFNFIIKQSLE